MNPDSELLAQDSESLADYVDKGLKKFGITVSKPMLAVACIVSGLMVILFPSLLVWIVGLFLVIQGALLLTDHIEQERRTATTAVSRGPHCHNCGAGNPEESVYCKKCGKELKQTAQVVANPLQEVMQQS